VALTNFIREALPKGEEFVNCDASLSFLQVVDSAYNDSSPTTPIYFVLSAGANPVKDVEALCRMHNFDPAKMLHPISLG
jgi:dynein heavy chain